MTGKHWRLRRREVTDIRTRLLLTRCAPDQEHPGQVIASTIPVPYSAPPRPRALTGARINALEMIEPGLYRRRVVPAPLSRLAAQDFLIRVAPGAEPTLPGGTLEYPNPNLNPNLAPGQPKEETA